MNASPYLLGLEKSCYNDDFAPKLLRHSLARRNMGGLGSTRWIGESTKDTVDDTRSLDINRLNHAGCLHPGYRGGWEWKRDGARVAWINLFRDDHRLILSYRYRKDGGEWSGCPAASGAVGPIFSVRVKSIRMRLGGDPGTALPFPERPKGMHHRTYERLRSEVMKTETLVDGRLAVLLW